MEGVERGRKEKGDGCCGAWMLEELGFRGGWMLERTSAGGDGFWGR